MAARRQPLIPGWLWPGAPSISGNREMNIWPSVAADIANEPAAFSLQSKPALPFDE